MVDLIRHEFKCAPGELLARRIERARWADLQPFAVRFEEYQAQARAPLKGSIDARGEDELRPYFQTGQGYPAMLDGLRFDYHDLMRSSDFGVALDKLVVALRHQLLYCHSVALENPLVWITDIPRLSGEFPGERVRIGIANYVRFLGHVEPLLASGALVLVEPYWRDGTDFRSVFARRGYHDFRARVVRDVLDGEARSERDDEQEWEIEDVADLLVSGLGAAQFHDQNLDLYLPSAEYARVLRAMGDDGRPPTAPERDAHFFATHLAALSMPRLEELEIKDLVAMRESEAGFESWRNRLRSALSDLANETGSPPSEDLRAVVHARLAEGRELSEAAFAQSSFLGRVRAGGMTLALGAMGAAIAAPVVGPGAFVAPAAQIPGQLLWAYLQGRGTTSRRKRAACRHYMVFGPATSG